MIAKITRPPAVAGQFYPDDPAVLRKEVARFLKEARSCELPSCKAVIAPHAGYRYSGPVAGSAFAALARDSAQIRRVILLGPSHRVGFYGVALTTADFYSTPLGKVPIDKTVCSKIECSPLVQVLPKAHAWEHSLEVEIPFLQVILSPDFQLVPLVVGDAQADEIGQLINELWAGPETRFVVSTDLSHFLDYSSACALDSETADAITRLRWSEITGDRACGYLPLRGMLHAAHARGVKCSLLDLRNSGDTAGPREQVVGYGAFALVE